MGKFDLMDIDPECIPLLETLRRIKGVQTHSSCCGHYVRPFVITFNCGIRGLNVIARSVNWNYYYPENPWELSIQGVDIDAMCGMYYLYVLQTKKPFKNEEDLLKNTIGLGEIIDYWNDSNAFGSKRRR